MSKYTVSLAVDGRVDVEVEATSFEEAFMKARRSTFDPTTLEVVDIKTVNATLENGEMRDYGYGETR